MTEPERFREVESIVIDDKYCWRSSGKYRSYLYIGGLILEPAEARELRDWLNAALPEEPDARDAEIERLRSSLHAAVSEAGELAVKIARLRAERDAREAQMRPQDIADEIVRNYCEMPYRDSEELMPEELHNLVLAALEVRAERAALAEGSP